MAIKAMFPPIRMPRPAQVWACAVKSVIKYARKISGVDMDMHYHSHVQRLAETSPHLLEDIGLATPSTGPGQDSKHK